AVIGATARPMPARAPALISTLVAVAVGARRGAALRLWFARRLRAGHHCRHLAAGYLHHAQFLAVQLQRGELAAPHRASVDGVHALGDGQAQRRPVAADHFQLTLDPARDFEPRVHALCLGAGRALVFHADAPAGRAVAHAGEDVDDRARAVIATEARRPRRLVAIHVAEQLAI